MLLLLAAVAAGAFGAYTGNRIVMGAGFVLAMVALLAWLWRTARETRGNGTDEVPIISDPGTGYHDASHHAGDAASGGDGAATGQ
jgi:membrane protein implicated in regulation of membrane protease activity